MPMMTSKTLKSVDSPKIQISEYLEQKTCFLQIKKFHDDPLRAIRQAFKKLLF